MRIRLDERQRLVSDTGFPRKPLVRIPFELGVPRDANGQDRHFIHVRFQRVLRAHGRRQALEVAA